VRATGSHAHEVGDEGKDFGCTGAEDGAHTDLELGDDCRVVGALVLGDTCPLPQQVDEGMEAEAVTERERAALEDGDLIRSALHRRFGHQA
jgi:hypothetical protein